MGYITHIERKIMNILMYHQQDLTNNINDAAKIVSKKYFEAIIKNIRFMSRLFRTSKIFFINDQCHQFSKGLGDNVTLIDLNKMYNPFSDRHVNFLKNYFHFYEEAPIQLILSFFERWFYIYDVLTSRNIENFVGLDSDCILLEDMSSHNYKKIGISHPPDTENCWPNSLICSTANLNKFLNFLCSFYEDIQKQKNKENYINSFFGEPKTSVCDMALWYLFKKQNPDLFINNLIIDHDSSVHDLGLGYEPNRRVNDSPEYYEFTRAAASKHDPQGNLEACQIKQIFYTEDGPCFEEKSTKELIKIKSLHFSPGTLKFDMIPFIEEYEKIYSSARELF